MGKILKPNSALSRRLKGLDAGEALSKAMFTGLQPLEERVLLSTTEDLRLFGQNSAAGDMFGQSIDVDGNFLIVGNPGGDAAGGNAGTAVIYQRNGNSWSNFATITADDATAGDAFGSAVSISGNRLVVAAPGDNPGSGNSAGSAYVFELVGGTWTQVDKIVASDGAATDQFGASVSIDGNRIIVGAFQNDDGANNSGSAYIYEEAAGNWTQVVKLNGNPSAFAQFGVSVDIDGDTAVVGAHGETNAKGSAAGAAYVFAFNGSQWVQQDILLGNDQAASDQFGNAVAIDGDRIVVGASLNDDAGSGSGSAYVFQRSGNNWSQSEKLVAPDAAAGDRFGRSVAIMGDLILVGASDDNRVNVSDTGSMYLFERSGNNWNNTAQYLASNGSAGDQLGGSVALGSDLALGGAGFDDAGGRQDAGSAYIFSLTNIAPPPPPPPPPVPVVTADLTGSNLQVDGTDGNDTIIVTGVANGSVRVAGNGINEVFQGVNTIVINGLAGNDNITVGSNVRDLAGNLIGVTINGGPGNDTITGGDGNDLINGGDGDDLINGGFGDDNLTGSAGNNIVIGGGGSDTIDNVSAGPQVAIGDGFAKKVTFIDADGTTVSLSHKGGVANITFNGDDVVFSGSSKNVIVTGTNLSIESINMLNTTAKSSLTVKTGGGDGVTTVGEITGSGLIGKINGKGLDLNGAGIVLSGDGAVGNVVLHDLLNGADITAPGTAFTGGVNLKLNSVGAGSDITLGSPIKGLSGVVALLGNVSAPFMKKVATKGLLGGTLTATTMDGAGLSINSISAGSVADASVDAPGGVKSIKALEWLDGSMEAGWLGNLSIKMDFGADVNLTNAAAPTVLKSAKINGTLRDSTWMIAGPAKTISAGSIADGFSVDVQGLLSSLAAKGDVSGDFAADEFKKVSVKGNATNANFLAGAHFGADGQLDGVNDTFDQGIMGTFAVSGATTGSMVGVGHDPVDGVNNNGDDTVMGGILSSIKALKFGGPVDETSFFAAGSFPTKIAIDGVAIDPATDSRFLVA